MERAPTVLEIEWTPTMRSHHLTILTIHIFHCNIFYCNILYLSPRRRPSLYSSLSLSLNGYCATKDCFPPDPDPMWRRAVRHVRVRVRRFCQRVGNIDHGSRHIFVPLPVSDSFQTLHYYRVHTPRNVILHN